MTQYRDCMPRTAAPRTKSADATIQIKRVYEPKARGEGTRFFVERLWPRGIAKQALAGVTWLKDVAPSATLRTWYGHRVERWPEFQGRYRAELDANPEAWQPILDAARKGTVTLLYGARDVEHNSAVVLRDYLSERLAR
jgi:uncharacterized protein YeaO (DUF488 family)